MKHAREDSSEVVPRDLTVERRGGDAHLTSRAVVCQATRSDDRPVAVTGHHGGIGVGFSAQINAEDVITPRRVLYTDATQHHVVGRVGGCRIEQLDRTVPVHREFSRRAATRSGAGCEDHSVTSADYRRDSVDGCMLEIADRRNYAGCSQVLSVCRVADQSDHIVAAIDEQACESGRDLPVRSRDCDTHSPSLSPH